MIPGSRALVVCCALLLSVSSGRGQFLLSADAGVMYDDNIDNNFLQQKDRIAILTLDTGYDWDTEHSSTRLFYSGMLHYYSTVIARSLFNHNAGLTSSHRFGEEGATLLSAGLEANFRSNRSDYSFYDHTQLQLQANLRHRLSSLFLLRGGYTFRSYRFREVPDFNYAEHYAFAQLTTSLPTSTTVILEADLGTKIYATPNGDTATAGSGGPGRLSVAASTPTVVQAIVIGRVGQSIVEGTGVSLTLQYLTSLEKETRYLTSSYGIVSDDDLFDDHYAYDGLQWSLMLTQLIGETTTLRLSGGRQDRRYTSRPAYDLQDSIIAPLRDDDRGFVSAFIEHHWQATGITIGISYDHIVNRSNDPYFRYSNDAVAVRFSVPLF